MSYNKYGRKCIMKQQIEVSNAVISFISDTKKGKYSEINNEIIDIPRNTLSRDEYVFNNEDMPVYFSMTN